MVNYDVVDKFKLEEMYPDIMKTISDEMFWDTVTKYRVRRSRKQTAKEDDQARLKAEAEFKNEAWTETDEDGDPELSDVTMSTMQEEVSKISSRRSRYSAESIKRLEENMQAQQQQFQAQLIEVQRQAQIEANRKMEENFERLMVMLADKTPEKSNK